MIISTPTNQTTNLTFEFLKSNLHKIMPLKYIYFIHHSSRLWYKV